MDSARCSGPDEKIPSAPGTRLSKLPVIIGPLSCFVFHSRWEFQRLWILYSKVISQRNKMDFIRVQNTPYISGDFWFQNLISGPLIYRVFQETGPRNQSFCMICRLNSARFRTKRKIKCFCKEKQGSPNVQNCYIHVMLQQKPSAPWLVIILSLRASIYAWRVNLRAPYVRMHRKNLARACTIIVSPNFYLFVFLCTGFKCSLNG